MPVLSYKYRLYPNRAQVAGMETMLGAFCDLYNAALQQRIEAWRRRGKTLRFVDQDAELKAVRLADERLASYSYSAEEQVLRRLDKAFQAFFRRLKMGGKAGFPRFRAKSRYDSAEFRVGDGLTRRKTGRIGIVGIPGEIKVRWHRPLPAEARIGSAILSRSGGKWHLCFLVEAPETHGPWPFRPAIGIDVGLTALIVTSNGEIVAAPKWTRKATRKQRRLQRALARCKRGSRRRQKAKQNLARHSAATAARRRDFLHKLSRSLVERYGLIALEDLSIAELTRSVLARSIHDAAWGQLRRMIEYKAASAGTEVIAVDPRGTSQQCSGCNAVVAKDLSVRVHHCPACGLMLDRDVNAARNILLRASGPGTGLRPSSQRNAA